MKDTTTEMEVERITIYPWDYDGETRQRLFQKLRELGIRFEYEQYA